MTTSALQHGYRDVYEQFYHEHDLVISVPFQFRRVHDTPAGPDSLLIKQQLPTKLYIGLTPQRRPGVFFGRAISFVEGRGFIDEKLDELLSPETIAGMTDAIDALLLENNYTHGLQIDIVCEQLRGHGFGFMGLFCVGVVQGIYLLVEKVSLSLVANPQQFRASPLREEIVNRGVRLDSQAKGYPSGLTAYQALSTIAEPLIQFGSTTCISPDNQRISSEVTPIVVSLSELTKLPLDAGSMPVDYGIISFGVEYDENEMKRSNIYFNQTYDDILTYYSSIKRKLSLPKEMNMPKVFPISMMSKYLKVTLLKNRQSMLRYPTHAHHTEAFIQSIADLGMHAILLEKQKQQLLDIYGQFHVSRRFSTECIGLAPMSTIKAGGSVLFVCHKAQSRQTVQRMLEGLHIQGYRGAHFVYLSRRDGRCSDGIQVEQWMSKKCFSSYVHEGLVVVVHSDGSHRLLDQSAFVDSVGATGLILDQAYGKVHLLGKKLTYRDLPSQPGTAEIIGKLLEQKGKHIHNSNFSCSSYSKNKNEMVGKIIYPFTRLVKTHFGKDIQIECKGTLFDFSVKLADDAGILHLIKPLGK